MAGKKAPPPNKAVQQEALKRWQRSETACRSLMDTLFQLQRDKGETLPERAQQYLSMTAIHYRKIRHGRVISATDFNSCVEVCQHALRTLQALDTTQTFEGWPQAEALQQAGKLAEGVLADYQKLKGR
ncbi:MULTISPECIES: hypothetical protein [unclassified Paludibacterium]|uniref:hypothetical protein n=1 Tax=unclassified Paludibacterium TaxID=2618429 RepID=UPI001C03F5C7|nr:hypothetical protein [Paludibacterium sp. B53371]BEV72304.1 hypothetical protein THUN1379_17860 [Paludibacterium sp. THUN1379]